MTDFLADLDPTGDIIVIVVGVASVGLACAVARQAWRMWR
jgi:hypothetical protein